jgi:hypothetical protein
MDVCAVANIKKPYTINIIISIKLAEYEVAVTLIMKSFYTVSCLTFSTLKMEAIYSSEIPFAFHWTTRRYILHDFLTSNPAENVNVEGRRFQV